MKMKKIVLAVAASGLLGSSLAHASSWEDLSINGFGTLGATYMGGEERTYGPKDGIDEGVSYKEDTKIGVQARYQVTDKFSLAAQAKAEFINEDLKAKVSWAYGSYQFNDDLTVRAGRLATPVYMKSDSLDVGYTYPWVRPPVEVYGQVPIQSYEGLDVLYGLDLGDYKIDFQAYAGTVLEQDFSYLGNESKVESDSVYGISATVPFKYGFVRAVHSYSDGLNIEVGDFYKLEGLEGSFTAIGGQFSYGDATVMGEYALRDGPTVDGVSQLNGYYVTSAYQLTPVLQPHITYSNVEDKNSGGEQSSLTAGVRYDVYPGVSVKAEYTAVEAEGYNGFYDASGLVGLGTVQMAPSLLEGDSDVFSLAIDYVF